MKSVSITIKATSNHEISCDDVALMVIDTDFMGRCSFNGDRH
jgi:hypothetical protein